MHLRPIDPLNRGAGGGGGEDNFAAEEDKKATKSEVMRIRRGAIMFRSGVCRRFEDFRIFEPPTS